MTNVFTSALAGEPRRVPPIWCMRQAGRYQRSYQHLRERHSFAELCRTPELAATVALNAVEEFDFDAAILFSDLLFPLDALGLPVEYTEAGPRLERRLDTTDVGALASADDAIARLGFQAEAVALTRRALSPSKGLIGFVGGPWTLFVYALEGTHSGSLAAAKGALPLYRRFARRLLPVLERTARAQLDAGADVVMVFDTAAGELSPQIFNRHVAPDLRRLAAALPGRLGYFARALHPGHLGDGEPGHLGPWAGVGLDWRWDLATALAAPGRQGFVQGNFDPALLCQLSRPALGRAIRTFLARITDLPPETRRGWICGLGHGVLPRTPEDNLRVFVSSVRHALA